MKWAIYLLVTFTLILPKIVTDFGLFSWKTLILVAALAFVFHAVSETVDYFWDSAREARNKGGEGK